MKELRHGQDTESAHGYRANKWQSWVLNAGCLVPEPTLAANAHKVVMEITRPTPQGALSVWPCT